MCATCMGGTSTFEMPACTCERNMSICVYEYEYEYAKFQGIKI